MTDYYVGPGGSDSNDGLTWVKRKLTLNGAEDVPVVAGDTVYVGPGTYREQLTLDVSGSSGNPITYIGDVTGAHTDMVGGEVVISGSDNDISIARSRGISLGANANYRTFRGLHVYRTTYSFYAALGSYQMSDLIIEDCVFTGTWGFYIPTNSSANIPESLIIRRSIMYRIFMDSGVDRDTVDGLIENCIFPRGQLGKTAGQQYSVFIYRYYNITINNCTFDPLPYDGLTSNSLFVRMTSGSNHVYLYNCILEGGHVGAWSTGHIIGDYNNYGRYSGAYKTNHNLGANSTLYANLFVLPLLFNGSLIYPYDQYALSKDSAVALDACGSGAATDDLFGTTRPSPVGKRTRGAIQYNILEREATIVHGDSPVSFQMRDAMSVQFIVPVTGKKMRLVAWVYHEANYAGTLPQVVIKQYGESDITITDTGSAGVWNELEATLTPAFFPLFIAVEIKSNNTATSGSYKVYWNEIEVT